VKIAKTIETNGTKSHYLHHVRDGDVVCGHCVSLPNDTEMDKYCFAYVSGHGATIKNNTIIRG
jgi:hypothetical protein